MALKTLSLFAIVAMSCSDNPAKTPDESEDTPAPNVLSISNIEVGSPNLDGRHRMISFDLTWQGICRTSSCPDNWDAVWIFAKYRVGEGEWKHATLSTAAADHVAPGGSTVDAPSDGKGIFICHGTSGAPAYNAAEASLRWNYGLDGVADDAAVSVRVFGLEMVYIPEGSFYAGDGGQLGASFVKGSNDLRPWLIESESAIEVTNTASDGYYYRSSKDAWSNEWNANEDTTGTEFAIPADFPKGFRAIYCMKYELSQQQYADFLNTLTGAQAANRYGAANFNKYGFTIAENGGVFSTAHPNRACGYISPTDGFAYADWAGLRPMSELEFEKICRGSGNQPVNAEYAWGTTYCKNAVGAAGTESDRERMTNIGANSLYLEASYKPQMPLNIGIFTAPGKSREMTGASYYGVMEMSGNLNETCITIGTASGRAFTYRNGNGLLAPNGCADESGWPTTTGVGTGFRGGCLAQEQNHMAVSDRLEAGVAIDAAHRHIPWGFRGVRTVM